MDQKPDPEIDMRNTDGGGSTLKSSKVAVVKVQNPELDMPMDPGQEEYFAQFLSSGLEETNKLPSSSSRKHFPIS